MLKIGYARVSTHDQDLELQIHELKKYGCNKIFTDKISGSKMERPGFNEALAFLREGDILVVWKLDRLGRTMKGLIDLIENLEKRKIDICSLTDNINTKGSTGRFFFHIMAAFAVMERELNRERTRAGLEAARRAGKKGGRPKLMTTKKIKAAQKLLADGMPAKEVAQIINVSLPTLYRYCPASNNY
ncbi:DNA invertase [Gilliamella sp. HK2]|jgi:DNA invertase Pin-like site-specific DNA recombinase|uniref:recombinase family protein n=1 Tax=unclassified Gilliamella TaxID=2685620 RepID=UPI00080E9701|nr:recombinase family protein [Gilliamella apicola]OCG28970.1 DNA invertase [Gilliamella apicola]OCG31432.1 DNA invertase [Gilliamella apicola]